MLELTEEVRSKPGMVEGRLKLPENGDGTPKRAVESEDDAGNGYETERKPKFRRKAKLCVGDRWKCNECTGICLRR